MPRQTKQKKDVVLRAIERINLSGKETDKQELKQTETNQYQDYEDQMANMTEEAPSTSTNRRQSTPNPPPSSSINWHTTTFEGVRNIQIGETQVRTP